ncbi:helix-turn-helix transcriptional regulator [Nocardioides sp.]|jgi:transcriptional regulator with XRE-family HTH domain|uniref:helix-turn-helix domain-containing protein n=1 Tax=Nocardioides sp. TaxID=35761 RepID=UPI002618C0B5|nr:helix-turn-helix transcriptional regulator [Nocardioides sp.]
MNDVADTLRRLRNESGLTQAALARRAGIPSTVLSAYENGRREPGAATMLQIARAAGFEPTYRRRPDPARCAAILVEVLALAEALPYRPRPLVLPRAPWGQRDDVA